MNESVNVVSLWDIISTISVMIVAWMGIVWLDRNVFIKNRYKNKGE